MPAFIGPSTATAYRMKRISLSTPGEPIPDGDGGYYEPQIPLVPPQAWARVRPASVRDLERAAAGSVIAQATHLVNLPFHPQITTETVVMVENHPHPDRRFSVVFVGNSDERNAETELICVEVVT